MLAAEMWPSRPIGRRRFYPVVTAQDIALKHERDQLWYERNLAKPLAFLSSRKRARLDRIFRRQQKAAA
jgi:hypothetical protein